MWRSVGAGTMTKKAELYSHRTPLEIKILYNKVVTYSSWVVVSGVGQPLCGSYRGSVLF